MYEDWFYELPLETQRMMEEDYYRDDEEEEEDSFACERESLEFTGMWW